MREPAARHVGRYQAAQWQAIAALGITAALLLLPGSALAALADWLGLADTPGPQVSGSDKLVHVALFGLCGYTSLRAWGGRITQVVQIVLALALFAGATEVLQLWVPGRSGSVSDFVADLLGALAGMGLAARAMILPVRAP
ncbi:MAG: VanZ family protein [Halieaceae bacterium]|uniref:VanZ family protein n=1 Tax=Haliea alexandrii TaxID=2448162 RepID=UPI000F0B3ED8|nr:VanZ family protein [Haliea alexandrii]MCR9184518.1 VanZ family protein [Halieaceae bacterium]